MTNILPFQRNPECFLFAIKTNDQLDVNDYDHYYDKLDQFMVRIVMMLYLVTQSSDSISAEIRFQAAQYQWFFLVNSSEFQNEEGYKKAIDLGRTREFCKLALNSPDSSFNECSELDLVIDYINTEQKSISK